MLLPRPRSPVISRAPPSQSPQKSCSFLLAMSALHSNKRNKNRKDTSGHKRKEAGTQTSQPNIACSSEPLSEKKRDVIAGDGLRAPHGSTTAPTAARMPEHEVSEDVSHKDFITSKVLPKSGEHYKNQVPNCVTESIKVTRCPKSRSESDRKAASNVQQKEQSRAHGKISSNAVAGKTRMLFRNPEMIDNTWYRTDSTEEANRLRRLRLGDFPVMSILCANRSVGTQTISDAYRLDKSQS